MLAPQRAAKRSTCGKRVIGRMPGTMQARDAGGRAAIAKAQEHVGVVEKLVMARVAPASILRLQIVEIEFGDARLRMHFRIGGDRDVEVGNALEARAPGPPRRQSRPDAARSASAPCGGSPRSATMWRMPSSQYWRAMSRISPRRADAGQVRRAGQRGLALNARDELDACARGSSRRRRR